MSDIPVALARLDALAHILLLRQPMTRADQAWRLLADARRRLATAREPVDVVIAHGQIERAFVAWVTAHETGMPPVPRATL